MKRRNKFLAMLFLCASMGLAACSFAAEDGGTSTSKSSSGDNTSQNQNARDPQIEAIYNLYAERAQAAGEEPLSYEDWLASIKGEKGEQGQPGQNGQDGHSPVVAINSDGYWTIDGVSTGIKATGNPGAPGQQGKDGTSLHLGSGAPNANLGLEGDSYIDTASWDFYSKTANGWQKLGNIKGADGAAGQNGTNGSNGAPGAAGKDGQDGKSLKTGAGTPDPLLGETGDTYIDTDTWNFYAKTANGWQLLGNIKGANGKDGSNGTNGTDGKDGQTAWSNTILPSEHGYVTANVGSALVGEEVVFTAVPDDEYYLSDLQLNGNSVINGVVNNTYTTEMVEHGFVVRALFSKGEAPVHVHEYNTYEYNDQQHWKVCACGEIDIDSKGDHEFNDWTIDVQPTEDSEGHKYRTCSVCGYEEEQSIPVVAHVHTSDGTWDYNNAYHYHICAGCGEEYGHEAHNYEETYRQEPTFDQDGFYTEQCTVCGYERQTAIPANGKTIRVMATNDIHGQIYEETAVDGDGNEYVARAGIDKVMTFLKNEKAKGNTLLIDQGDTWQGSAYSNYNHGKLLTDIMNYVQFDARTIGNHDFDWGMDPIEQNAKMDYDGYTTPTLAANIYDYDFDTKTEGDVQQSQLGVPSVTYEFDGVKVGIIGTIGSTDKSSQITSICTNLVKNIIFKKHIPIIKQEANRLKEEEDCDIIILSHHGDQDDLLGNGLNQFVDLALCAHTHQWEHEVEGNLVYVQSNGNNKQFWEIALKYNLTNHQIEDVPTYMSYAASWIAREVKDEDIDSTITELITANRAQCEREIPLNSVVANNVVGTFGSNASAANIMADAVYEQAKAEGYDIICSYVNNARHDLGAGQWTYADVYQAFPFENDIYIMDVTAAEMVKEVGGYNYVSKDMAAWPAEFDIEDTTTKYRIAVIDYLGVHSDYERDYDYFPSCDGQVVATLSKKYRPILVDYLDNHDFDSGTALNATDYASTVAKFKRKDCALTKAFNITYMYNYEGAGEYLTSVGRQAKPYSDFYPPEPTRPGYVLAGWFFDPECTQPVKGKITGDIVLYAGWEAGSYYSFDFSKSSMDNGNGGYYTGNHTFDVQASNGETSINVSASFESGKYSNSYDEFGMAAKTGMLITLPEGYIIRGYKLETYYDNIELYSNSSRNVKYEFGTESEGSNHKFTYTDCLLNYSSLYLYNKHTGIGYVYSLHLSIMQTQYAPSTQGALPNSGYGFKFSDNSYMFAEYFNEENGFQQYRILNRSFNEGEVFQLYNFAESVGWVIDIDVYSFGGTSAESTNWQEYIAVDKDAKTYTVLKDFKVSAVYIKLKLNEDQIYFGLA